MVRDFRRLYGRIFRYSLDLLSFFVFFSARFSFKVFCGFLFSSRFGASLDFILTS